MGGGALTFRRDLVEVGAERTLTWGGRFLSIPRVRGILWLISPCEEESAGTLNTPGPPHLRAGTPPPQPGAYMGQPPLPPALTVSKVPRRAPHRAGAL